MSILLSKLTTKNEARYIENYIYYKLNFKYLLDLDRFITHMHKDVTESEISLSSLSEISSSSSANLSEKQK